MKTKAEKTHASKPSIQRQSSRPNGRDSGPFVPPSIQAKLTINTPGDPYEREADAMADQVVQSGGPEQRKEEPSVRRQAEMEEEEELQRQEEEEEELQRQAETEEEEEIQLRVDEQEEEELQRQEEEEEELQRQAETEEEEEIQLQVEEEEEALQLQAESEEELQRQCSDCEEEEVQRQEELEEEELQRQCNDCEEEESLQLSADPSSRGQAIAPPIVNRVVAGGGDALEKGTQSDMEGRFGTDFSNVRIHNDSQANRSAKAISAQAYTYGSHVVFARGKYEPHTEGGQHLLAHELTHVVQQGGAVRRSVADDNANVSPPPSTSEPAPSTPSAANSASSPPAIEPEPLAGTAPAEESNSIPAEELPTAEVPPGPTPEEVVIEPIMPPPPEELGPAARGRMRNAQSNAGTAGERNATLPTADETTQEAREGVTEPVEETEARASGALTASLAERPAPSPEIEELCENIRRVIRDKRPPDEDSLLQADPEEAANEAGSQLNENVESDVDRVEGDYDELDENPTGEAEQIGEEVETPPEQVDSPAIRAAGAAPDPLTEEEVSLEADVEASAAQMEEAGMSTPVADVIEDGPVAEARGVHQELEETAAEDPAVVLAEQDAALGDARGDMEALQAQALAALEASRSRTVTDSGSQQTAMVGSEEQQRQALGTQAENIFTAAQDQVNLLLEPLTATAMEMWERGKDRIATEFEQHLARVQGWVDDRHSGFGGGVTELWDDLTGLPGWVTDEYDDAERSFGDSICDLIREISTYVNGVILTCEELIDNANEEIDTLFANAPEELQTWAAEQREVFQGRLDGLREQVSSTQQSFNEDLANRAAQAVQEVREQVHALREAAKGLLGRIADFISDFLDDPVRAIINGLLSLVGIEPAAFWALVNRIEQVISDIADDPLGFASNLLAAIGAGFQLFFDNILTHLFEGFIEWLFSGLGAVGVEIPADFSLSSIITFFLQLMGITWERIRELLAKHIGEENVALLEQAFEIVSDLIELGPAGVFELIKDQLDPQHILDTIINMAIDFVVETLITQATIRIIALFNPVGAIAQAIEAIYKVLKWIFENAARIFSFVETVVNGMADIIAGNIAGMASAVEGALARLLVPVIDFIAEFMSLGDLPDKVADAVRGLQEWVEGILDRVIGWLADQARSIMAALGFGGEGEEGEEGGEEGSLEDRVVGEEVNFRAAGKEHELWVRADGAQVELMVASDTPMSVSAKLSQWEGRLAELPEEEQGRVRSLIGTVRGQYSDVLEEGEQAQRAISEAQSDPTPEAIANAQQEDNQVEQAQQAMTDELIQLFETFEGEVPDPEWLDLRVSFTTTEQEPHTLYFERENEEEIDLIRASDLPTEILAYLNTLAYDDEDDRNDTLADAKTLAGEIKLMTRQGATATTAAEEKDIVPQVNRLSQLLIELVEDDDTEVEPPAQADWSRDKAPPNHHYSRVHFLSSQTAKGGGKASGTSPQYDFTIGQNWVRMHLISEAVGGPGDPTNWVAAPNNINTGGAVLHSFEASLKNLLDAPSPGGPGQAPSSGQGQQPSVVWVETEVTGYRAPLTDNSGRTMHFASGVHFEYGLYRPEDGDWVRVNAPVNQQNVTIPPPTENRIRLSSASGTAMKKSGFDHLSGEAYSNRLVELIKQTRQAGFGSYDILKSRLLRATRNSRLLTPGIIDTIVSDFNAEPDILLR